MVLVRLTLFNEAKPVSTKEVDVLFYEVKRQFR
jgi:hypothetical protein